MNKLSIYIVLACQLLGLILGPNSIAQEQAVQSPSSPKGVSPSSRQAIGPLRSFKAIRTFCGPGYTYHSNSSLCETIYAEDGSIALEPLPIPCPYGVVDQEDLPSRKIKRWSCEPIIPEVDCPEDGELQWEPLSTYYYICRYPDATSVPAAGRCAPGFSRVDGGDFCGDPDQYCCYRMPSCGEIGKFLGYGENHVVCCMLNESCSS